MREYIKVVLIHFRRRIKTTPTPPHINTHTPSPANQYQRYLAGRYNKTPVIVGINSGEGISFSRATSPNDYIARTRKRYGSFADKMLALYPATPEDFMQSSRQLTTDGWSTCLCLLFRSAITGQTRPGRSPWW